MENKIDSAAQNRQYNEIKLWLNPTDPSTNFNEAKKLRHQGSGAWILENPVFSRWKSQPGSFLWLHGMSGCGKTVLSSTIIQHLEETTEQDAPILYYYFSFSDANKQSLDDMLRSLISQLYVKRKAIRRHLDTLYSSCNDGSKQPARDALCETFYTTLKYVGRIWIVLDALDESSTRSELLSWIKTTSADLANLHLLVTSRPEHEIEAALKSLRGKESTIPLDGTGVANDIRSYVHVRILHDEGLKRWRSREDVQEQIANDLVGKAGGM